MCSSTTRWRHLSPSLASARRSLPTLFLSDGHGPHYLSWGKVVGSRQHKQLDQSRDEAQNPSGTQGTGREGDGTQVQGPGRAGCQGDGDKEATLRPAGVEATSLWV
jgi:hypothetical protein